MIRPKVLMMVVNDIHHDSRVYKSALALADGGADVTVLGWSPQGYRQETKFGPVRIIRVPVDFRFRGELNKRRRDRRQARLVRTVGPRAQRLATLRANLRRAEAEEIGGATNRARARVAITQVRLQREGNRVLKKLGSREDQLRKALWERWEDSTQAAYWRHELPEIDDLELAYAPVVDSWSGTCFMLTMCITSVPLPVL